MKSDLDHVGEVLNCTRIEQVWALHVAKMAEFGFDRMIYGANRFHTRGKFGDISDSIVLTNHDKSYIDLFFGEALYIHAPMAIWSMGHVGACSWQWAEDRRRAGRNTDNENKILDLNVRMGVHAGYSISFAQATERSKSAIGLCARAGLDQADVEVIWARHGAKIEILNLVMDQKIASLPFERQSTPLTERQREVLQWVADGKTAQEIAMIMGLNQATIEKHLRLARANLNADTTAQAVLKASVQNQFFLFEREKTGEGKVFPTS